MKTVVGYEAGATPAHPLIWGAAAVQDDRGVFNAVLGYHGGISLAKWREHVAEGTATATEVEIEIEQVPPPQRAGTEWPYFVMSLRKDIAEREPYHVEDEFKFMRRIVAIGHGTTRTYYVFEDHEAVTRWLYHLHAGLHMLVPV